MVSVKTAKPIAISSFSKSRVDIIIPFHAQYDKVTSLIKSILLSVKSNPFHLYVHIRLSVKSSINMLISGYFFPKDLIARIDCRKSACFTKDCLYELGREYESGVCKREKSLLSRFWDYATVFFYKSR